jgi:hypothetical protein
MLYLVVVVADASTEHAEYYSDDYDDSGSHWACQIPLVFMNDLVLSLGRPIVNVVVACGDYLAHLKSVWLVERFGDTCREEVLSRGLLLNRVQLLVVEAVNKLARSRLVLLALKIVC